MPVSQILLLMCLLLCVPFITCFMGLFISERGHAYENDVYVGMTIQSKRFKQLAGLDGFTVGHAERK